MKILNKILIIPIILGYLCFSLVYADKDNSDCWIFWVLPYQQKWKDNWFNIVYNSRETNKWFANFLTIDQQKAIITNQDLNTAILNLKKYCCEKEMWWLTQKSETCINDKSFFNENSLDSPYLFDHIFDVIMRRLNWLSWDYNIYKGMTLDDKWAERRSKITKQATSTWWSTPQTIIDLYSWFRTESSPDLGYNIADKVNKVFLEKNHQDFLSYVSWKRWEESEHIAKAIKDYNKRSLYDRYINACALTEFFYELFNQGETNTSDKIKNIYELSRNSCNKAVEKQIQWEANYVTVIEQRASQKFQTNYIEWYTSYMYERQEKLQNLIKDSKNRRLDVIRAVPGLQRQCVK